MSATNTDHLTLGDVILERLGATTIPAAVKKHVLDFKKSHAALAGANAAAETARGARDAALAAVGDADDALDAAIGVLRDKMIGAGMGNRTNPFSGFSSLTPTELTTIGYAREVKELRALAAKVKKAKPAADVAKQLAACEKLATGVETALAKLTKPQLALAKAMAARDALLPEWTKALGKLKRNAEAAWFEDRATYKAIFAAPSPVQETKKAKRAPKKANGAPASPSAPTGG
jgi:hypothetical protein